MRKKLKNELVRTGKEKMMKMAIILGFEGWENRDVCIHPTNVKLQCHKFVKGESEIFVTPAVEECCIKIWDNHHLLAIANIFTMEMIDDGHIGKKRIEDFFSEL